LIVYRSSQYPKNVAPWGELGRHVFVKMLMSPPNWIVPFDSTAAWVNA